MQYYDRIWSVRKAWQAVQGVRWRAWGAWSTLLWMWKETKARIELSYIGWKNEVMKLELSIYFRAVHGSEAIPKEAIQKSLGTLSENARARLHPLKTSHETEIRTHYWKRKSSYVLAFSECTVGPVYCSRCFVPSSGGTEIIVILWVYIMAGLRAWTKQFPLFFSVLNNCHIPKSIDLSYIALPFFSPRYWSYIHHHGADRRIQGHAYISREFRKSLLYVMENDFFLALAFLWMVSSLILPWKREQSIQGQDRAPESRQVS